MPRKGRDLERLVSILEKTLSKYQIKIKSPDYIEGINSGSNREIDISLRGKIGSANVLIILECRDRKKKQQVAWIEQIASKKEDVEAHKAIAVTSTGFSKGAVNTALRHNIELRTMETITPDEIVLWFEPTSFVLFTRMIHNVHIEVDLLDKDIQKINALDFHAKSKSFSISKTGELVSFLDIWNNSPLDEIYKEVPDNGDRIAKKIVLNFTNPEELYEIVTEDGNYKIQRLLIQAELYITKKDNPLSSIKIYKSGDEEIAKTAQFDFDIHGTPHVLEFHKATDTGQQSISIRKTEE